jgi:glycosyltransferase involved in cell wall biosynthesis
MSARLLLISSKGFPGSYTLARNLHGAIKPEIDSMLLPIEDLLLPNFSFHSKRLTRFFSRFQTKLQLVDIQKITEHGNSIVFSGWSRLYDIVLEKLNRRGIQPSVILCSTPGQAELSRGELAIYHRLIKYTRGGNIKYFLLNKRLHDALGEFISEATYLPYAFDTAPFTNIQPRLLEGDNIDLFSPVRPGKNLINQIIAFKMSNVHANLHINFHTRDIKQLIDDINTTVVSHDWIDNSQYYSLVAGMDLSLQVTFTESFSYAVAERMYLGVPVLTSCDIYFMAEHEQLSEYLRITSLDTPREMARKIRILMDNRTRRKKIGSLCKEVITKIATKNNREIVHTMTHLFDN